MRWQPPSLQCNSRDAVNLQEKRMANDAMTKMPELIRCPDEMRLAVQSLRAEGQTVGLVPTMGALHEGHLSLVDAARETCDVVVVTIFVNPTQFGPGEDLGAYPRTLDTDMAALAARGVELVFAPTAETMYPADHDTTVVVGRLATDFEGRFRPHHFPGVATIVLKLFQLVPADFAFFGQKDYQQSLVIRRLVADLDVPIEVRVCPTVRESDGLAKSSRNVYLSKEDRQRATCIWQSFQQAEQQLASGRRNTAGIINVMRDIIRSAGVTHIDYVALADPETLKPVELVTGQVVALVAIRIGETRLIDNHLLVPSTD